MIGTRLGHFEILEQLGEGGMGVVYKARDTHLDRFVAIKVLPADKVADPERKARFVQEARAASALNHPNIIHIYDISSDAGTDFIAMEYVAGTTLDQLIPRKGMRLSEALKIAAQVADAMARAHEAGIVHRDLKPSNVMVDERGLVKVVDFGLAKLAEPAVTGEDAATRTLPVTTGEGRIVGTLAYMSPEQAEGKPLDGRSDIFSFGAVLYEMVTGRRAFGGDTAAGALAAVIKDHPQPVSEVASDAPADLEKLIARCLQKAPERRWQTMADLRVALSELKEESDSDAGRRRPAPAMSWVRRRWAWLALGLLPFVAAGAWLLYRYVREAQLKALLTGEDIVVLADFANSTGDPAFDVTLREALSNEIQNSSRFRALSPALMRVVLADMRRPADAPITAAVAREICLRAGERATVEGSIAALGSTYVLTLKAISCQTGDTLASQVAEAAGKEQVLGALAKAVGGVREKLGETLPSIERLSSLPGTTASFEAYQAYAMGMLAIARDQWAAAIPYFVRATELDPTFASAYLAQAIASGATNQPGRARELFRRAFELRANANERERLMIEGRYYEEEGEFDKARAVIEQLVQLYPNHQLGHNVLANLHREFGDWEKALPPSREFVRLTPEASVGYGLLMLTLIQLDRFEEAHAVAEMPVPRRLNPPTVRLLLLRLGYLEGDQAAAREAIRALEETPMAVRSLGIQRADAFAAGRFRSADTLQTQADETARRRNLGAAALAVKLDGLSWKANAGVCSGVSAAATPDLLEGDSHRVPAAIAAVALCGDTVRARALVEAFPQTSRRGQLWSDAQLPLINARVLLAGRKPAEAIAALEPARAFERAVAGIVLARGEAYLMADRPGDAVAEFRKILNVKANLLNSDYNAAQVGLARALAASGDVDGARKAYESFFDRWKSADADVPLLLAARAEYANLQRPASPPGR